MRLRSIVVMLASAVLVTLMVLVSRDGMGPVHESGRAGTASVHRPVAFDESAPLAALVLAARAQSPDCEAGTGGCGVSPFEAVDADATPAVVPARTAAAAQGADIEQTFQGTRPAAVLLASFDGHGYGMAGPHGEASGNNPSDNSMAVGPDHIVEIVNSRMAVYTKQGDLFDETGRVLYGPIGTNVLFAGFGGQCELRPNGDAVVRYDQLADRWLYVMPLFRRAATDPSEPSGPYGMCYAVSTGSNPLGPYYRYEYERPLFPDYPRPAVWPDGYYVPTSTGDDVIEKHACVVDRTRMLRGEAATEQCIIIPDVNFLNNADIDGQGLPPAGAPNIMMATGGTQLREDFEDDGIYAWDFHVDWDDPDNTRVSDPRKIEVAPYHYLCNGQLTRCVPQPDTDMRLDAQGDKIMQRLVYRNVNGHESIVAVHSVNTAAGGGGVRWYEFRLDERRRVQLHQQGTYAPDGFYRWMGSPAMDRQGNIGIGYSFGGAPNYAGQRFAARLADDPPGLLTFHETVLVHGQASQTSTLRWQDYTQMSMDPTDDCTFWYVGDYLKEGAPAYTTRIGAFRLPGCLRGNVHGTSFFDVNHNGRREPNEPGLAGWSIEYAGERRPQDRLSAPSGTLESGTDGGFTASLPADPAYFNPAYTFSAPAPAHPSWMRMESGLAFWSGGMVPMRDGRYTVTLGDGVDVVNVDFGNVCVLANADGAVSDYWLGSRGREVLAGNDQLLPEGRGRGRAGGFGTGRGGAAGWRSLINNTIQLARPDGTRFEVSGQGEFDAAWSLFSQWLRQASTGDAWSRASAQLASTALNVTWGRQSGDATVHDPVRDDWPTISSIVDRVSGMVAGRLNGRTSAADSADAVTYASLLADLNGNRADITPPTPESCPPPF